MALPYQLQKTGQEIDALLQKIDGLDVATDESSGLMSAQDKSKLDGIESGAEENLIEAIVLGDQSLPPSGSKTVTIPMDDAPAMGSNNPVKSSGVYAEIADIKEVIPTTAAPGNKLTPKSQVDELIATALLNYYLKSETYSKSEVNALIAGIKQFTYQVADSLPTASEDTMFIVYLIPSSNPDTQNVKDEYITVESNGVYSWEQIGSTSIDISGKADKDTDAIEGNLAKFDANGNPVDAGIAAEKVAQKGDIQTYSGNLVDTRSAGTAQEFTYRKSGGDGVNWMRRIKGKSQVWNQLMNLASYSGEAAGLTVSCTNGKYTISGTAASGGGTTLSPRITTITGHKYFLHLNGTQNFNSFSWRGVSLASMQSIIFTESAGAANTSIVINTTAGNEYNASFEFFVIDLTLMFGEGKEPSTVEEFEAMYDESYYPYQPGVIKNNDAVAMESVGFNQWDEDALSNYGYNTSTGARVSSNNRICNNNPIKIIPQTYYAKISTTSYFLFYDAAMNYLGSVTRSVSGEFTPAAVACYMNFMTDNSYGSVYNNDICINISDASRNGTYEPYWKKSIQLGLNAFRVTDGTNIITVNGLKSAGDVFDEIDPVRKKYIKRIGEVDLGTLYWDDYATVGGPYPYGMSSATFGDRAIGAVNLCSSNYAIVSSWNADKGIRGDSSSKALYIIDSSFDGKNAAQVKTAMSGVMLNFELATPVEYDLVDPIPNAIEVDENGTERAIFPEAVDPSAPFCSDSNYSVSTANLVRKLNDAS